MELKHIKGNTYYIDNPTNIGVYKISEDKVYIIDSGNDKEAGKKIIKLLESEGLQIEGIISTHSNADHIGGNKLIQDRIGAKIFAKGIETSFSNYPVLESSFLYGGYPFKDLRHKFLMAQASKVEDIENLHLEGIEYFDIKGHFFDMIGLKTEDDVYFIGDSLFSEETISKYHIFFIYDVKEFLNTLDYLSTLHGFFVPSHAPATNDISKLIDVNRKSVLDTLDFIYEACDTSSFETILKKVFDTYGLMMSAEQYVLIGSTVKSYLSYLYDEDRVTYEFKDNTMIWSKRI